MPDKPFSGLPSNPNERKIEAVGVRIIGEKDPKVMTKEEFEHSSELLFHGSSKPFDFKKKYDYQSKEHLTDNDGSATLGFGFYATDKKEEAGNYSFVRQFRKGLSEIVIKVLPYQSRMLDLRRKNDLTKNAPASWEFIVKWREKYLNYHKDKPHRENNIGGTALDEWEKEYANYLNQVSQQSNIDLRTLLDTVRFPAPPWSQLFSDFIREEGYDGLIYNEGGEGKEGKGSASYVFYNLDKIGTYESWHKKL